MLLAKAESERECHAGNIASGANMKSYSIRDIFRADDEPQIVAGMACLKRFSRTHQSYSSLRGRHGST
jgi:hypothetical protein